MTVHLFDDALRLQPEGPNLYTGSTTPAYRGFVGPFGGVTAATALRAVLLHPLRQGVPLALTLHFAAPLGEGEFTVEAVPARTNRSTRHWRLEIRQNGRTAVIGTAFFGVQRAAWSARELAVPPVPPPEHLAVSDAGGREPWTGPAASRYWDASRPTGSAQAIATRPPTSGAAAANCC